MGMSRRGVTWMSKYRCGRVSKCSMDLWSAGCINDELYVLYFAKAFTFIKAHVPLDVFN